MRTIELTGRRTHRYVRSLLGHHPTDDHYDPDKLLGGEPADVYKPDGSLLLRYRPEALPLALCEAVRPTLRDAARLTNNRGLAAGRFSDGSTRQPQLKPNGTLTTTTYARKVHSDVVGYMDRTRRHPYCRTTHFSRKDLFGFRWVVTLAQAVDEVFARECPDRHAAQMRRVGCTPAEWVIPGTSFTTVTVNKNFATACHTDKGDLPEGFGVIAAVCSGQYDGGYLVFPKYRVAVDLGTTDVLLCDVHEVHGNTRFVGTEGGYERLTAVFYFRRGMASCLPRAEELAHAQRDRSETTSAAT